MFKKYHKRGYTIDKKGYIHLWKPKHPFTNKKGYIKRARYIMEEYLGRFLKSKEIVHHINQIKDDDRIKNLQLFSNDKKHMAKGNHKVWNKGKKLSEEHRKKLSISHKGQKPWCKGKKFSIEYKKKLSDAHKGQIPWNKGKHIYCGGKKFKKGHIPWNKNKPNSRMLGNTYGFKKGNIPWNKKFH